MFKTALIICDRII